MITNGAGILIVPPEKLVTIMRVVYGASNYENKLERGVLRGASQYKN
ncbi:MAG: hypothetical protein FWF87_04325 [Synergistaceae bacterium]|nr:hypothetical protein [Synergistaceae bacterium]